MDIEIQNKNSEDNKLLYYFSTCIKGHVFSDGKNINILPPSVEVV